MKELALALKQAAAKVPFEWLRERRWFSSKGQTLESLEVVDWGELPIEAASILAIVRARYASGRDEQYLLPLAAHSQAQLEGVRAPAALSIEHGGTRWYVHEAFQLPSFQRLLIERLINGADLPLESGMVEFSPEPKLRQDPPPRQQIKLVAAEQSNSSIIYDRQVILKCFRRVVAGVNPDVEVSRFLTRQAGFTSTPAMLGCIIYHSREGEEHALGLLQSFVPNEGDAWEHALGLLKSFFATVRENGPKAGSPAAHVRQLAGVQLSELRRLGRLTGEMHLALASDPTDPAFAPRPLTADQVAAWQEAMRRQADAIVADLAYRAKTLPAEQRALTEKLVGSKPLIDQRINALSDLAATRMVTTRFHGDYHLGQVLVDSTGGFQILDFEGEPLRSLAERRAHGSPLKDVAGMLRSFGYASHAGLIAAEQQLGAEEVRKAKLADWADAWENAARDAFLEGYQETARGAAFVPAQPELFTATLAAFELEKALYELNYELNNRPTWLTIPLRGIQRTISAT